jgi:hypothetical protein
MRHIKIYEDYSDDELMDLLGDMKSIGQAELRIEIKDGHRSGMSSREREEEKEFLSSWFFDSPKGKIKITSALMDYSAGESKIALKMNNGDVFEMKWSNSDSAQYFIDGREIYLESEQEEEGIENSDFPLEFASAGAVLMYKLHLEKKFKGSPSLLQRLKGKLGIKESEYSDEELKDLLGIMRSVGQSLTEEEEDMLQFVNQFGGGMSAEDYAETLYDYYKNPGDYGIDPEGDYYDMIWYLYENSAEDHARFDLSGPMRMSNFQRFSLASIENEPLYKLYLKMSDYYKSAKR